MIDRIQGFEGGALGPEQVEQLKEKALEMAAAAREQVARGGETIRKYTIKQPAKALGLALGVGVLLGWLIKRR
jgi:ElaB/YqjD/DUF883 family membrane-anchored ribosome-binding protein